MGKGQTEMTAGCFQLARHLRCSFTRGGGDGWMAARLGPLLN